MKKLNTKYVELHSKAVQHFLQSKTYLLESLKELLRQKGFSEDVIKYFDIQFVHNGVLTVITFNGDGDFANLGYENWFVMSKQEIIDSLSRFLKPRNIELLNS